MTHTEAERTLPASSAEKDQPANPSRRSTLADAALRCFERIGYPGTKVEDVLQEAGVARSTFYRHFDNLDQVVLHLIAQMTGDLMRTAVAESLTANAEPADVVSEVIARMVARDHDSRIVRQLSAADIQRFSALVVADPETMNRLSGPLEAVLLDGQRTGRLRTDLPVASMTEWISRNIASIRFRLPVGVASVDRLKDYARTFVLPALLPPPAIDGADLDRRLSRIEDLLTIRLEDNPT